MNGSYKVIIPIILASILSGCSTSYRIDRTNDAADIFNAAVGVGGGLKVRIGPINISPLMMHMSYAGLEGGDTFFGFHDKYIDHYGGETIFLFLGGENGNYSEKSKARNKAYKAVYILGITSPASWECTQPNYPASYFSQIELCGGLGGTLRFGLNPGELIDFILGFSTIDLYHDDVESIKMREQNRTK